MVHTSQRLTTEIFSKENIRINISNIYRKTAKYSNEEGIRFWEMIDPLLQDHIIVGDFNAHHPLWYNLQHDGVGNVIAEGIIEGEYRIFNEDNPTFRARNGARDTSVDLTLCKNLKKIYNISW